MRNLLQLSEMMIARQSDIHSAQVQLLAELHRRMILRARALQGLAAGLSLLGAWYIFQEMSDLQWLPFHPIIVAYLLVLNGFYEIFYRNVKKLTVKLPFLPSDKRLADKLLSARGDCKLVPPSRIQPIWYALRYKRFLLATSLLIAVCLWGVIWEHSKGTIILSIILWCAVLFEIYNQGKVLRDQRQMIEQDEKLSDKYYFLIPYRWNYIYDYPRLLASTRFSAYQKKKIESLYRQAFVIHNLWFGDHRQLCWHFWYDDDDDRKDERTMPYRIPGGALTINR